MRSPILLADTLRLTKIFRGLPGGYLGTLEQRLNDTEAVLHDAITEIHRLKENSNSHSSSRSVRLDLARPSKITKASRLAEWAKYPLTSPEDVEVWWTGVGKKDYNNESPVSSK